jgi:hypothetical protein
MPPGTYKMILLLIRTMERVGVVKLKILAMEDLKHQEAIKERM